MQKKRFRKKNFCSAFFRFFSLVVLISAAITPRSAKSETVPPWETGASRGEDLQIEILTFGPGPSLEEWWGHIGLRMKDTRLHFEVLYNWGLFTFDKQFLRNFVTGRLRFWAAGEPLHPSVAFYKRQGRVIHAIPINLSPEKKLQLAAIISENMKPENREYNYEYLRDNCSTRIRDHLSALSDGSFKSRAQGIPGSGTYRTLISTITAKNLSMNLLIMFLLGSSVDAPNSQWEDMFLPLHLEKYLTNHHAATTSSTRASTFSVGPVRVIQEGKIHYPERPVHYFPFDILSGLLFGAVAVGISFLHSRSERLARAAHWLLVLQTSATAVTLGIVGFVLLFFNVFTEHTYTYWNENLFFGNPFTLALLPLAVLSLFRKYSWTCWWTFRTTAFLAILALLGLSFKALPISQQDNWVFVRSITPALVLLAFAWHRIAHSCGSTTRKNVS
jgi:hypothetical protein